MLSNATLLCSIDAKGADQGVTPQVAWRPLNALPPEMPSLQPTPLPCRFWFAKSCMFAFAIVVLYC
jgi:hypothetical protein